MSFAQLLQSFFVETMDDMVPCVDFAICRIGDLVPWAAVKQGRQEQRPYSAYPGSGRGRGRQQQRQGEGQQEVEQQQHAS